MGLSQLHNSRMRQKNGLHLEELKAPIEVHIADDIPHPTMFQAKEVPL